MRSRYIPLILLASQLSLRVQFCEAQESAEKSLPNQATQSPAQSPQNSPVGEVKQPVQQTRDWRYQLTPGDSFSITFPLTPEFNQPSVSVQPDGYVTLQGIGEVSVAGKTLPELRKLLQEKYSKIVSSQPITVELKDFEKPYFVVGGEVGRPGKFDLRSDTTVAEAVAIAGGFKETSKHSQVLLFRRVSDQWMEAKVLDLKSMLKEGNLTEDLHLRTGDMIYVPKNTISKVKPFIPIPYVGAAFNPF